MRYSLERKKRKGRFLAALLCVCVTAAFPLTAFAGTDAGAIDPAAGEQQEAPVKAGCAAAQNAAKTSEAEPTLPKEVQAAIVGETTYYFYLNESAERITGWQTLSNGKTYYFAPNSENEELNGAMQTGWLTLNGSKYYLSENPATLGQLQTGVKKINGKLYYFGTDGRVTTAKSKWISNKKYYAIGGGRIAAGAKKIGKTWYYFSKSTGRKAGKGFVKVNGKSLYYCKGAGKLKTGWMAKGKYGYYFSKKTAKRAYNTKVGYLKIGASGRLGEAYARGIRVLNKKGWTLRRAYKYSRGIKYAHRGMRRKSIASYAIYGFKHYRGNCYVHASTFYVQAMLLGYNAHQVSGWVNVSEHSWVTIRQHGRRYVYDLTFPGNGWKIWYGKKGTWRYHHYHTMKK